MASEICAADSGFFVSRSLPPNLRAQLAAPEHAFERTRRGRRDSVRQLHLWIDQVDRRIQRPEVDIDVFDPLLERGSLLLKLFVFLP